MWFPIGSIHTHVCCFMTIVYFCQLKGLQSNYKDLVKFILGIKISILSYMCDNESSLVVLPRSSFQPLTEPRHFLQDPSHDPRRFESRRRCRSGSRSKQIPYPYPVGTGTNEADSRARFSHCSAFTPLIKSHRENAISAMAIGSAK